MAPKKSPAQRFLESLQSAEENRDREELNPKIRELFELAIVREYEWLGPGLKANDRSNGLRLDDYLRIVLEEACESLPVESARNIQANVAIGELPLSDANASCRFGPSGEVAILLNSGLITLFLMLSKLLAARTTIVGPPHELGDHPEPVLDAEDATNKFKQVVMTYVEGRPLHFPWVLVGPLGSKRVDFVGILFHHAVSFVVGHELAHYVLGHTAEDRTQKEVEYQADLWSYKALMKRVIERQSDIEIMRAIAGTELMLEFLGFIDASRADSMSHPSGANRILHLRESVQFHEGVYQVSNTMRQASQSLLHS